MVFGGGRIGLMGAAAQGVKANGGRLIGVIPEKLNQPGIAYENCDELIETPTMHTRKETMESLSSGFIVLPGGFGTMEELMEVITLKQLGYHNHPIVIVNHKGFWQPLLEQFSQFYETGFAHPGFQGLYVVADTALEAVAAVRETSNKSMPDKLQEALHRRTSGEMQQGGD